MSDKLFAEIDDQIKLHYQLIGDVQNSDTLLVFLHEGLGSIPQWKGFPEMMCNQLKLPGLVYERYGYGHSTAFFTDRQVDYLKKEADYFLPQLLQLLKLADKDLLLIGHSDGASIALYYAALFPEKVKVVVSMAAHVFVDEVSIAGIKQAYHIYQQSDDLKKRLEKYHFDHTDSTFYAWAKMWQTEEFKEWSMEEYLPLITCPILAIQGQNDEYGLPSQVDSIVTHGINSNNKGLMVADCFHSPHLEQTELVLTEISKFIVAHG